MQVFLAEALRAQALRDGRRVPFAHKHRDIGRIGHMFAEGAVAFRLARAHFHETGRYHDFPSSGKRTNYIHRSIRADRICVKRVVDDGHAAGRGEQLQAMFDGLRPGRAARDGLQIHAQHARHGAGEQQVFNVVRAENARLAAVRKIAEDEGSMVLPICAQMEQDIASLEDDEKELFLSELGLEESGLDRLIRVCYDLLGLMSFLTAGPKEVRAWTIKKGTKAPQAAGKIHTDFERGFIRAEVVSFDDLMACGSLVAAKEKGLVRSEGKEYVMRDGDIVEFRFNV